jgi:homoserine kinase
MAKLQGLNREGTKDAKKTRRVEWKTSLSRRMGIFNPLLTIMHVLFFIPLRVLRVFVVHTYLSPKQRITVRVPASSANLGPGFDHLGLALAQYTTITVTAGVGGAPMVTGLDAQLLAGAPNLVESAMQRLAEEAHKYLPPHTLQVENGIPVARGMGGSAAAVVGGLLAANALLGEPFDRLTDDVEDPLLAIAAAIEGHADNVAAALYGGIVAADGGIAFSLSDGADLRAVLFVPETTLHTTAARAALPPEVSHRDAVVNVGHVALLVAALIDREYDALSRFMRDRLHEPYRAALIPWLEPLIAASEQAGAYGACLSGAGPCVLALAAPSQAKKIAAAMRETAAERGYKGKVLILAIDDAGATVVEG